MKQKNNKVIKVLSAILLGFMFLLISPFFILLFGVFGLITLYVDIFNDICDLIKTDKKENE
jgi:hypothetical protein